MYHCTLYHIAGFSLLVFHYFSHYWWHLLAWTAWIWQDRILRICSHVYVWLPRFLAIYAMKTASVFSSLILLLLNWNLILAPWVAFQPPEICIGRNVCHSWGGKGFTRIPASKEKEYVWNAVLTILKHPTIPSKVDPHIKGLECVNDKCKLPLLLLLQKYPPRSACYC